ncbi:WGR domain-containing protein [uncultured Aquimarina sp.]|uniref:WGR domain-containing protein n=1 Tax=uncultured Aquimarina sp. TaxID=575652 RepID=UPI0026369811|nr:WGR domain-containing protein [uncultured Aquimarina sp.]
MKLLKSKSLFFKDAKSDKVYEVDLCEVDAELYVVNFRYGRRGSSLREGTKTVFPVSYEEATVVFDKLVKSKESKGYAEEGKEGAVRRQDIKQDDNVNIARNEVILKYLKDATLGNYTRDWKVSRIIWRAGVLGLKEALQYTSHFISSQDEFEQYAAIWALAKLEDTSFVDAVSDVFNQKGFTDKVGRIAVSYVLKGTTKEDQHQKAIVDLAKKELPVQLINTLENKQELSNELAVYFLQEKIQNPLCLYYLYIISHQDPELRKILHTFINRLPIKIDTFKSIRYIFKSAEVTNDVTFYALLSKRISISKPGYNGYGTYDKNWNWISADEEKKKANPRIAFSGKTKEYFGNAAYKTTYFLGQSNTNNYVDLAVALLCSLDDAADNKKEETQYLYTYNNDTGRYENVQQQYPKYCDFPAVMYILHGNSERFRRSRKKWYYTGEMMSTSQLPREEALPEVWNSKPQEVLYILAHAKSNEAISFSLRIIQDKPNFLDVIEPAIFKKLITHYDARVVDIVLEVLERQYESIQPEQNIILSLLKSNSTRATTLGLQWLQKYEKDYFSSSDFPVALILIGKPKILNYLSELYKTKVVYNLPLHIDQLALLFDVPNQFQYEFLLQVNELISDTQFGVLLKKVSKEKILQLAESTAVTNKLFAATLSKVNTIPSYDLVKEFLGDYLDADEELLRKTGVALLADFPDQYLLENHQVIKEYCFSPYTEVREAIQPAVGRLIGLDTGFKKGLLRKLLQILVEQESYEGIHKSSHELLIRFYGKDLNEVSEEGIITLILSKYEFAQKLGTPLFQKKVQLQELTMSQLVSLATSDVRVIRDTLEIYFKSNPSRINYELEEALRIFNTNWKDARVWAFAYFEKHIKPENWTVDTLLYVCDHTKNDVESFGRKIITTHFRAEDGLQLLLKLQEHPTKTMQFFTTNYLDTYAKDAPEVILKLEAFFKTVLFNINTNNAAKTRVYAFLEKEAIKNEMIARMTIRILNSIIATKTIKDKSKCIDIMLAIHEVYPSLETPLIIKTV